MPQDVSRVAELEQAEVAAILAGDFDFLATLWHPDYIVNAPHNQLTHSASEVVELVKVGVIAYDRFDRIAEGMTVHGDTVIVMGHEIVQPKYGPQAGDMLTRRYSNVWRFADGDWRMIGRHANVVSGTGQNLDLPSSD